MRFTRQNVQTGKLNELSSGQRSLTAGGQQGLLPPLLSPMLEQPGGHSSEQNIAKSASSILTGTDTELCQPSTTDRADLPNNQQFHSLGLVIWCVVDSVPQPVPPRPDLSLISPHLVSTETPFLCCGAGGGGRLTKFPPQRRNFSAHVEARRCFLAAALPCHTALHSGINRIASVLQGPGWSRSRQPELRTNPPHHQIQIHGLPNCLNFSEDTTHKS